MTDTMNRQLSNGVNLSLALIAILSCSDNSVTGSDEFNSDDLTADAARVASVAVSFGSSSIAVGDTTRATATLRDYQGRLLLNRIVTWTSSDNAVATVSPTGLVTGVAEGTATIAASRGGKSGSGTIAVTAAVGDSSAPPPQPTAPGTVTDLKVTATDSNGVTLSFTQVDDGTGQPAKYDIRYAVPAIAWGSAPSVTSGSCAVPVAGTAIGSALVCKVLGLNPSTRYDFQLIAFRGTLNFNAVFGSLSVVATATTMAVSSPPPPPPGTDATWRGNEPAGMTFINERAFNSLNEPGWGVPVSPGATIVSDATAPHSPSSTIHFNYPAGFVDGKGPESTSYTLPDYRVIYICYWVKHSANWYGNITGVNKHGYVWYGNTPAFVDEAEGIGTGPLTTRMGLQSVLVQPNSSGWYTQNLVPSATYTRGKWDYVEILLTGNTSGSANGALDWYLNGVHVAHWAGIQYSAGTTAWNWARIAPVWGGNTGETVPADQYMAFDHYYLSGRN
jgi:hypothetical protein